MHTPQPRPLPRPGGHHHIQALLALLALAGCVALSACGSSAKATGSTASTASTAAGQGRGPGSARFTALRSCLAKQGITLPGRPSGASGNQGAPGTGGPGGQRGGFGLPKGVTQEQFQAALKKCGGDTFLRRGGGQFGGTAARAALVKYAACLRQNGINVPAPNTNGGPVFNTNGIDTTSAKFKAAEAKCRSDLPKAFARGNRPPGGPGGAPPSAGGGGAGSTPAPFGLGSSGSSGSSGGSGG
jgi:hypothetical protein